MRNMIDKTLSMAKEMGINDLDVIISANKNFSLKSEKGDLSEYKKSNSHSLGVRVIIDEKVGTSFTEALDEDSIKQTLESAKNNSKYGKVNPHEKITASGNDLTDINEKANIDFTPDTEDMITKALYMEQGVLDKEELADNAPYNGVAEGEIHVVMGNSLGNRCEHKSKYYSCYTSALLKDGDKNAMHFHSDLKRDYRELDFEGCIDESIEVAKHLLTAEQIKTDKYDVKFKTDLFQNIFESFKLMFSAKSVIDKVSPWREDINKTVTSEKITLVDDPFYAQGFNVTPFDSEGYKKQKNTLVENGVLKQFIHNSATASELGMDNNFCASRSSKSPLGVGLSNFIIEAGPDSESLLNDKTYVEIIKAQGLHSGINAVSGDFSLGVSGRVWENGKVTKYFKDVTVNGNFFNMLKEVSFVGDKLHPSDDRTFFSPHIIFSNLSIAGN